jgi:hypothetical protein
MRIQQVVMGILVLLITLYIVTPREARQGCAGGNGDGEEELKWNLIAYFDWVEDDD